MSGFINPMQQLQDMIDGGWSDLDGVEGKVRAAGEAAQRIEDAERRRQARVVLDCFGTDAGAACLALLREKTIERRPTQAELDERDPHAFALMQARRMGEQQIIWLIEEMLAFARGQKEENDA